MWRTSQLRAGPLRSQLDGLIGRDIPAPAPMNDDSGLEAADVGWEQRRGVHSPYAVRML